MTAVEYDWGRHDLGGLRRGEVFPDLSYLVATYVNPSEACWSFDSRRGFVGFWWAKHTSHIASRRDEHGEWIFEQLGREHTLESLAESLKRARRLRERDDRADSLRELSKIAKQKSVEAKRKRDNFEHHGTTLDAEDM